MDDREKKWQAWQVGSWMTSGLTCSGEGTSEGCVNSSHCESRRCWGASVIFVLTKYPLLCERVHVMESVVTDEPCRRWDAKIPSKGKVAFQT